MKLLVTIDYTQDTDPIRTTHGLGRLLALADDLPRLFRESGVEALTPVIWECEAPKGYCVFEAESATQLEPVLSKFGHHPVISVLHVRFLDEAQDLAREKLLATSNQGNR